MRLILFFMYVLSAAGILLSTGFAAEIPPPNFYLSFNTPAEATLKSVGPTELEGTVKGPVFIEKGINEGAFEFDGENDYIAFAGNRTFKLEDFTIAVWVRSDDYDKRPIQKIFDTTSSSHSKGGIGFNILKNRFELSVRHSRESNSFMSPVVFSDSDNEKWHHLAATLDYDRRNVKVALYLDGIKVNEEEISDSSPSYENQTVYVANNYNLGYQREFDGALDELLIFKRALSADEIKVIGKKNYKPTALPPKEIPKKPAAKSSTSSRKRPSNHQATKPKKIELGPTDFQLLPLASVATGMTVTEDGKAIFIAQGQANKISVLDSASGKMIKEIPCKNPQGMLCVGGNIYVANYGAGTISVFSAKNYELTDQLLAGNPDVYYLSAPKGRYFKGIILASCGKPRGHKFVRAVDTATDSSRSLFEEWHMSVATVDYTGEYIAIQSPISQSPSATLDMYEYPAYLTGRKIDVGRAGHEAHAILGQLSNSPFWLGAPTTRCNQCLYAGTPPMAISGKTGLISVPSHDGKYLFALKESTVEIIDLSNQNLPTTGITNYDSNDELAKKNFSQKGIIVPPLSLAVMLKNEAVLYLHRGSKVYRLVLKNFIKTSAAPAEQTSEMPDKIIAGIKFEYPLFGKLAANGRFAIVKGPESAIISPRGVIRWTPQEHDVGSHAFKVKGMVNGVVSFKRFSIEVFSKALATKVGGDLNLIGTMGRHYILSQGHSISTTTDAAKILLLDGKMLRILDSDGLLVERTHRFDKTYKKLSARRDYFLGLRENGVDRIDPYTFEISASLDLPVRKTIDMVLHPKKRLTYISFAARGATEDDILSGQQVLCLDEKTGASQIMSRVFGKSLAIDPLGRVLYTAIKESVQVGTRYEPFIGMALPAYEHIDILISYALSDAHGTAIHMNKSPGENGQKIVAAPDGRDIAYISGGGYRSGPENLNGYTIPAFSAKDISAAKTSYDVKQWPGDFSYHPYAPLVAGCSTEGDLFIFNRETGAPLQNRMDIKKAELKEISSIHFSPSGRYLLAIGKSKDKRLAMAAIPLSLTRTEQAMLGKNLNYEKLALGAEMVSPDAKKPSMAKLKPLTKRNSKNMSLQRLNRNYAGAVVVIQSESGSGTGFFISKDGYILTCAHVIPRIGNFSVSYRSPKSSRNSKEMMKANAAIVALDATLDLALLKIDTKRAVPTVCFEKRDQLSSGENVCVIGNPGAGDQVLDYTLTEGIVSSTSRSFEGSTYIQTTAAINPGSSGSPLFNTKGNVIGLVVLKAYIEGAGFAIPIDRIYDFLSQHADK